MDDKKSVPHMKKITSADVAYVAARMFSTKQWLKLYGEKVYGYQNRSYVAILCKRNELPEGWDYVHHGTRFFIYHPEGTTFGTQIKTSVRLGRDPKISDENVDLIRKMARSGLRQGDKTKIARQFDISVSQVSRILAEKRRQVLKTIKKKIYLDKEGLEEFALNKELVEAVFERLMTPKQWFGCCRDPKEIETLAYVYFLCGSNKMPKEWIPVRVGESWLIYHKSLKPRSTWLK